MVATNTNGRVPHPVARPAATSRCVMPDLDGLHDPRPTWLPNGWGVEVVDVTPKLAEAMLVLNSDDQRAVRPATVDRYAADMRAGHWHLTHQGVAFDAAGRLHDGQHRLGGVVAAGVAVPMLVFYGAGGVTEMSVLDTGAARSAVDAAAVAGLDLGSRDVAVIRHLHKFATAATGTARVDMRTLTHSEVFALAERHAAHLDWAESAFGWSGVSRRISTAPVKAAAVAARYHCDHARLDRFVSVLVDKTPATQPGDETPKLLRHWLTDQGGRSTAGSLEAYLKTCNAARLFMEGRDVAKLYAAQSNPFPLPG